MSTKTTLSITEARKNIFEIIEDIQRPSRYYTLTAHGQPKAILLSAEEFESLLETIDVLREMPDLLERAEEAREEMRKGNTQTLDEFFREEGYIKIMSARKAKNKNR